MTKLAENNSQGTANIADGRVLGSVDEFHSQKCYDLYMYAVGFAKQINSYLDAGYLVFDNDEYFKNKFVFYGNDRPYVAERSGDCSFIYFGSSFDNEGRVWLQGEETKKTIKDRFSKFKFVKPCHIERMQFNCV